MQWCAHFTHDDLLLGSSGVLLGRFRGWSWSRRGRAVKGAPQIEALVVVDVSGCQGGALS